MEVRASRLEVLFFMEGGDQVKRIGKKVLISVIALIIQASVQSIAKWIDRKVNQ